MILQMLQKFSNVTSNSTQCKKAQKNKKLVSQKNWWKMQNCVTRIEQNNDHTGIVHDIQFRSSFEVKLELKGFQLSKIVSDVRVHLE